MDRFKQIPVKNLVVNPENDRHGTLGNEEMAINWLLKNKKEKMRALARDIAISKRLFETPLVKDQNSNRYVVYDGNRRTTCLKILLGLCDDYELYDIEFYNKLREDYDCLKALPEEIICEVSASQSEIDEIIQRRHAPKNSGEIKLNWDPYEKQTFLERTGRAEKINFAKEVQDILQSHDLLSESDKIPLTNFNRLFSNEKYRNLAGVSTSGNKVEYIADENIALTVLSYIAKQMILGNITLENLLNDRLKMAVFADLEAKDILPKLSDKLSTPKPADKTKNKDNQNKKIKSELARNTLLSKAMPQPMKNKFCTAKICNLFIELQYDLLLNKHINSISITFRVLIELLTQAYADKHNIKFGQDEKLSNKIGRVFDSIDSPKKDIENVKFIKNLSQKNNYFSVGTLNAFLHSKEAHPISQDLISFADNFEQYICLVIEDLNEEK